MFNNLRIIYKVRYNVSEFIFSRIDLDTGRPVGEEVVVDSSDLFNFIESTLYKYITSHNEVIISFVGSVINVGSDDDPLYCGKEQLSIKMDKSYDIDVNINSIIWDRHKIRRLLCLDTARLIQILMNLASDISLIEYNTQNREAE